MTFHFLYHDRKNWVLPEIGKSTYLKQLGAENIAPAFGNNVVVLLNWSKTLETTFETALVVHNLEVFNFVNEEHKESILEWLNVENALEISKINKV